MPNCPKCEKPVYFAEKKSSMGMDWHSRCLRCERCNKTLTPGSHAVHQSKGYCHKPCYATMFGPKGTFWESEGSQIINLLVLHEIKTKFRKVIADYIEDSRSGSQWDIFNKLLEHHQDAVH